MNYKNLEFPDTLEGFKEWIKEFPHMIKPVAKKVFKDDLGNYFELHKVQMSGEPFLGISVRVYNEEDKDFHIISTEEKKLAIFHNYDKIKKWADKQGIRFTGDE